MAALTVVGIVSALPAQTVSIEEAEFLVFLSDGQGKEFIFQTDVVPLIPNRSCYGWRLRLSGVKSMVKFKEIFTLPTEPEYWGGENDEFATNKIAKGRRTSVTEMFAMLEDGWISNSWCVAEGDPEGRYSMEVHVNGQFIKRFNFEVRDHMSD